MGSLRAGMSGFDIAPRFHPKFGAWGTTPIMTEIDMPLLTRCLALEEGGRAFVWFGHDLCGENVAGTDGLRREVAEAIGLPFENVLWSTSQTHSSPTLPGSNLPGGSSITVRGKFDESFCDEERRRFVGDCVDAAKRALSQLQPATVSVAKGYCDNISYNSRFPMPTGGVKFSRNYAEGVQGGRYFDPTVALVRFDDRKGKAIGAIFNFNCHPATMINDKYLSPDYVGTARRMIEEELGGAPAMFLQGFCGNIHNYYMFGTPEHAKITGRRLGTAAVAAMKNAVPIRGEPLGLLWRTVHLPCRPMYSREEVQHHIDLRNAFVEELKDYPDAVWVAGVNVPEFFNVAQKTAFIEVQMLYLREALRILDAGEPVRSSLALTLGGVRIGDLRMAVSPGENFAETARDLRTRSPFVHTMTCGDTNGLFGYIGTDEEIDRRGYETDTYWKMLYTDGFRLPLAKGSAECVISSVLGILKDLG